MPGCANLHVDCGVRVVRSMNNAPKRSPEKRDAGTDTNRRKRPRQVSTQTPASVPAAVDKSNGHDERPDPPPPPPASLVRLLRRNKEVIKYFTSLQENLQYDVRKWKHRARAHERTVETQQAELSKLKEEIKQLKNENGFVKLKEPPKTQLGNGNGGNGGNGNRDGDTITGTNKDTEETIQHSTAVITNVIDRGEQIQDYMFDFESSSDDENVDGNDQNPNATTGNDSGIPDQAHPQPNDDNAFYLSFSEEDDDNGDEVSSSKHIPGPIQVENNTAQNDGFESDSSDSSLADGLLDGAAKNQKSRPSMSPNSRPPHHPAEAKLPATDHDLMSDTEQATYHESNSKFEWPVDNIVIEKLFEANNYLGRLGISLVSEEMAPDSKELNEEINPKSCDDGSDIASINNREELQKNQISVVRRSDTQVLSDLFFSLRSLSRVYHIDIKGERYQPFMTFDLLPCNRCVCKPERIHQDESDESGSVKHPAIEGFRCALLALRLMDVYCCGWNDTNWSEQASSDLGNDERNIYLLLVGMQDRHEMVRSMLSSLIGAIGEIWSVQDRSSRVLASTVHFEMPSKGGQENESPLGSRSCDPIDVFQSKSHTRLSGIVERCMLADLTISLHLLQNDPQTAASIVWKYFLSSVPMLNGGEYPKFPPVLSFCVLESMLRPSHQLSFKHSAESAAASISISPSWFLQMIERDARGVPLYEAMSIAVHAVACIHRIRLQSEDAQICDVSRVELAAYTRIGRCFSPDDLNSTDFRSYANALDALLSLIQIDSTKFSGRASEVLAMLRLLTVGDTATIDGMLSIHGPGIVDRACQLQLTKNQFSHTEFASLVLTRRRMTIFSLEHIRQKVPSQLTHSRSLFVPNIGTKILVDAIVGKLKPFSASMIPVLTLALDACVELSDGESAIRLMRWMVHTVSQSKNDGWLWQCLTHIQVAGEVPTVRVISLERRKDRMAAFMAQALQQQIMVVRGVIPFAPPKDDNALLPQTFGEFAFDGQGRLVDAERWLADCVGSVHALKALVASEWCPHNIKMFDKDAPESEEFVRISPSEKACALSHISSWRGVLKCVSNFYEDESNNHPIFRSASRAIQQFEIAGFASGRALLFKNESMPPAPVCVILEDDAILVDRFRERLTSLLSELPRDFHFCSLGYGRPKTAPLVRYSEHIGIPSCIWYLTGYVLSLDGARFLLDNLPVRGPVDSWIGLNMFEMNWDNIYGRANGVGVHAKLIHELTLPSRKDLSAILNFRAFAAMVPLCSQKVGTNVGSGAGPSWRKRDTDIVYSGNH